jgi:hypothetical protein
LFFLCLKSFQYSFDYPSRFLSCFFFPLPPFKKLLQHPELSNSQLLADFLSPNGGETQFLDKILPDVNLGKSIERKIQEDKLKRKESLFSNCLEK